MKMNAKALALHFELPEETVLEVLRAFSETPQLGGDEAARLDAPVRAVVVEWLADNSARCRGCASEPEPSARVCTCRRLLGRCPVCNRRTSFSLQRGRWIGRDEYRCDACSAEVAPCQGERSHCGWWAPLVGRTWRRFCPRCEADPQRLIDEQTARESMLDAMKQISAEVGKAQARHHASQESREARNARLLEAVMKGPPKR